MTPAAISHSGTAIIRVHNIWVFIGYSPALKRPGPLVQKFAEPWIEVQAGARRAVGAGSEPQGTMSLENRVRRVSIPSRQGCGNCLAPRSAQLIIRNRGGAAARSLFVRAAKKRSRSPPAHAGGEFCKRISRLNRLQVRTCSDGQRRPGQG